MFEEAVGERPQPESDPKPVLARKLYVRKDDIKDFGFTEGCPKCDHWRKYGQDGCQKPHSDACRERITLELLKTPEGVARVEAVANRSHRTLAEYVEHGNRRTDHGGGEPVREPEVQGKQEGPKKGSATFFRTLMSSPAAPGTVERTPFTNNDDHAKAPAAQHPDTPASTTPADFAPEPVAKPDVDEPTAEEHPEDAPEVMQDVPVVDSEPQMEVDVAEADANKVCASRVLERVASCVLPVASRVEMDQSARNGTTVAGHIGKSDAVSGGEPRSESTADLQPAPATEARDEAPAFDHSSNTLPVDHRRGRTM